MSDENPNQPPAAPAPAKGRSGSVQVRMLVDHKETDDDGKETFYGCNSVQTFPRGKADSLVESGVADDNEAAVRYATAQAEKAKAAAAK